MLPTPCTSHVPLDTIYEPAEDSYLFLDSLSAPSESAWLAARFAAPSAAPLLIEVGSGSGVVLAFTAGNSELILGRRDVLALGTDVNRGACLATRETVEKAVRQRQVASATDETDGLEASELGTENNEVKMKTLLLSAQTADLVSSLRDHSVDILLFNPPYVPTEEVPDLPESPEAEQQHPPGGPMSKFDSDSYFLSLTYAGGPDGMRTTARLLEAIPRVLDPARGVAYVLLCRQNRPADVVDGIRAWGGGWTAEVVGDSGGKAGWEKLVIVRIWRGEKDTSQLNIHNAAD
ncbi:N5-glutamine methyltransferase MTQ2 [Aspergillus sp. HF37]|nr:N5-glutamine methyltransferase MTQ2 [Aspergillus sp. HF37]